MAAGMIRDSFFRLFWVTAFSLLTAFAGSAESTHFLPEEERYVLEQINQLRQRHGAGSLRSDPAAQNAAALHVRELHLRQTLSHRGADGSRVAQRYRAAGGTGQKAGENLGAGPTADAVISGWMNSESHRENLLNPQWYAAGIGGLYSEGGRIIIVAIFSNSRWDTASLIMASGRLQMEGRFYMNAGQIPQGLFVTLDGQDREPETAAIEDSRTLRIRFSLPEPEAWKDNRIAAMPLTVTGRESVSQTDLIFLRPEDVQ